MSYILDALRRADAERERGAVPGLQSQQHPYVEDDAAKAQRPRALVWAVVALAFALVIALGWNFVGGPPPARPVVEGAVTPAPAPAALPTVPPAAESTTAPAAATATPSPTAAPHAAATPPAGDAVTAPAAPAPRATARHTTEPKRVARRSAEPATDTTTDTRSAPAAHSKAAIATESKATTADSKSARATGDARVYQQSELPDNVRRDLPKLAIGGASYSGDAASRMVMINGQIFHEGDQLAPDLVLERIKLKSAVLSYKGYRYEVTF